MGETYRVTVARGVLDVGAMCVTVGTGKVGVTVAGKRLSGVIVGTGEERAACRIAIRSCALPVAGISLMICFRMFSLIGGTTKACGSPL